MRESNRLRRQTTAPAEPPRRRVHPEHPERRDSDPPPGGVKNTNVVRGDDRPQAVRHQQ